MTQWVVFTDLDETLLDREGYGFEAARPALEEVRRRGIPLVLCTSKTAAETLHFQRLLGAGGPFVVEAGGGVWVPKGCFDALPGKPVDRGAHELLPLAAGREEVLRGMRHLKAVTADSIRGFEEMTAAEIAGETGLPIELARLSKEREFDEPFRFTRREAEFAERLPAAAAARGLRVSRGGRYWHLHGDTDKGRAVEFLMALYRGRLGAIRTIAVGDSGIDLPMLAAVDVPIAVRRQDGTHDAALEAGVRGLRRTEGKGPAGWNEGVLEALAVAR